MFRDIPRFADEVAGGKEGEDVKQNFIWKTGDLSHLGFKKPLFTLIFCLAPMFSVLAITPLKIEIIIAM